jgi:glycolate oxidase
MPPTESAVDELAAALAASSLLTDPDVLDTYSRDEAHLVTPGRPTAVLMAGTTADVSTALRWASRHRVPVVPRGAGTGLAGGATAVDGCLVVSTIRMNAIREISAQDQLAVVEPGVITADLDRAAERVGLMYPPDPSSREISTIGGNIATNAGGLRCVKYGVTGDAVLALEVVLADGRVLDVGHRTVKGVAGYDIKSLFVGSEGTLGIITAATVRLRPRPSMATTVVGSFPSLRAAGDAVAAIVSAGLSPSLMELMDRATLRSIDEWKGIALEPDTVAMLIGQADGIDSAAVAEEMRKHFELAGADFADISTSAAEASQLLEIRRLAYPAAERLGRCLVEDVSVPRSKLPEMLDLIAHAADRHGVQILTVAHAGDGNVHPTFVFDARRDGSVPDQVWAAADDVFRAALNLGGTLTGEHGVGALKRRWLALELDASVLDVHQSIKDALDPVGILNPGKAF